MKSLEFMQTSFPRVSGVTSVRSLTQVVSRSLLLTVVLAMMSLIAQAQDSISIMDRLSFGARGGYVFTSLEKSQTSIQSTSAINPPLSTTHSTTSLAEKYTIGPSIQFNISERVALNVDVLYKRTGYEANHKVTTQRPEDDEDAGDLTTNQTERTTADYWDFPILMRYYNKAPYEGGMRLFFSGGVAFRSVTNIKSFSELFNDEGLSDTNTIPAVPANKFLTGAVAGLGVQLRDEIGLKVEIGARYTRWFKPVFSAGVVESNQNQGEVFVGITF